MRETMLVWSELVTLLAEASGKEGGTREVRRDTLLEADLDLSSLMVVNLLISIEEKFAIRILDDDFDKLNIVTAGDLNDLIETRIAAAEKGDS